MPPLSTELRNLLEKSVIAARDEATKAARNILNVLQVAADKAPAGITEAQRDLRNALRAKARQLSGTNSLSDGLSLLVEEIAYSQWHRMLFARFLAENQLLMHPHGVAVSLQDCTELAQEEGDADAWQAAARYAALMLPGIFRSNDPTSQLRFAPEGRIALEKLLTNLPVAVFLADDALGWVYQFWQSKRKDEVNASGKKVGGANISPVTQLFTEHYMVQFLLENSLGAWWAGKYPDSPLLKEFSYLRFREHGTPAAGKFEGWPQRAAEVTMMDPCCGSGHFLVAGFEMLRRMRMEEESLGEAEAGAAVIRDNLYGLELDPRCTQIAAFALALAAWKAGGHRPLPLPNIACSGIAITGTVAEWRELANGDINLAFTLERLYQLFKNAPDLGSLINPAEAISGDALFSADYGKVEAALHKALTRERSTDPAAAVFGDTVEGIARAAHFLSGKYTLVATNVPYLGRGLQDETLKKFCDVSYPESKSDLATVFLERIRKFVVHEGSYTLVTPQNWLFLASYKKLRERMIREQSWCQVSRLGPRAFETIGGEVVNVALLTITNKYPNLEQEISGVDVSKQKTAHEKASFLCKVPIQFVKQNTQLTNPDVRIILEDIGTANPLSQLFIICEGMHSGDYPRFGRKFWEIEYIGNGWSLQAAGPRDSIDYTGREHILFWQGGDGELIKFVQERLQSETVSMWIKGEEAWNRLGVAVSTMSDLKTTLYTGEIFTHGIVTIIPKNQNHLNALWTFCKSKEFLQSVRKLDQKVSVARGTFDQIPFDLEYWQKVADEAGPLPEPYSNDPTQWLFEGHHKGSSEPLQVAVARLLGYHWPQQSPGDGLDSFADADGLVGIPSLAGEQMAAERLRALLAAAYGAEWSTNLQDQLLAGVGYAGKSLEAWLRDGFWEQHCRTFQNRPFIWQIWDGLRDGFSVLVNYHKLDYATLEKLTYTYLGDWITARRAEMEAGKAGGEARLLAAQELKRKLELILKGERPHDIYVRWKRLEEQPIGWRPDLNDGVRLNIRPFVTAGVLRGKVPINWNKDRGTNLDGSERLNDTHQSLEEKRTARQNAKK